VKVKCLVTGKIVELNSSHKSYSLKGSSFLVLLILEKPLRTKFQTPWANISDLMSGLMMVFLLISVTYGFQVNIQALALEEKNEKISEIADSYTDNRAQIYEALNDTFSSKFDEWSAVLDKNTLTLRFNDPALLFEPGSSDLTPRFENILTEFWTSYIIILQRYSADIREVKIEGHTSSEWTGVDLDTAYFKNMSLSQARTRSTLEFCYLRTPSAQREWVRGFVTANGMSSSKPVLDTSGLEDVKRSRRVEFTIVVDSSATVRKIGEALDD